MSKIRYLKIRFDNTLTPRELPLFRAAIIEATGRQSSLFHNHTEEGGCMYRYPLIQYKLDGGKACILCLESGADDIHHLFHHKTWTVRIGRREETLKIDHLSLDYAETGHSDTERYYRLLRWQGLNQNNHRLFEALEHNETAQLEILQDALTGHLLAFAEGINWRLTERIRPRIIAIDKMNTLPYKGQRRLTFDLQLAVPLLIPDFIGLGKGSALGFGVIRKNRERLPQKISVSVEEQE